jgi:CheY-like chemotaxis protein
VKILIVEDDADSGEALMQLLTDVGHEVRLVMKPTLAAAAASELRPEVAILDIGLPGMSGYELLQVLRALPELSACRYVAATAMAGVDVVKRSFDAGFERHLTKPLPIAELLGFLESAEAANAAQNSARVASE